MSERVEPELLGALADRYGPALLLYARQWCRCPEDAVQEAFVKLARQRRMPEQPGAWLFAAVRNAAISAARAERRRKAREAAVA